MKYLKLDRYNIDSILSHWDEEKKLLHSYLESRRECLKTLKTTGPDYSYVAREVGQRQKIMNQYRLYLANTLSDKDMLNDPNCVDPNMTEDELSSLRAIINEAEAFHRELTQLKKEYAHCSTHRF